MSVSDNCVIYHVGLLLLMKKHCPRPLIFPFEKKFSDISEKLGECVSAKLYVSVEEVEAEERVLMTCSVVSDIETDCGYQILAEKRLEMS